MILCNLCAKHQATIYFKGVVHDQTIKLHLCESCAKKKGMMMPFGAAIHSLSEMVMNLASGATAPRRVQSSACDHCGLTFAEFQQTSQVGCPTCYKAFAPVIGPLLERIQGSRQHVGKTARGAKSDVSLQDLAQLKLELQEAIKVEAYEKAAALRDQIHAAEKRLKQTQTGGEAR
jgi:protein arginine kinase activator